MEQSKPEWEEIQQALDWMYKFLALPEEKQIAALEERFGTTSGYPPTPLSKNEK